MYRLIVFTLTSIFFTGCATTLGTNSKTLAHSSQTFDLSDGWMSGAEPKQSTIDKIISIEGQGPVLLNWQFVFSNIDDFSCDNRILTPNNTDETPNTTDPNYSDFHLPVSTYSRHFLLSVLVGSPIEFPFNAVSCYRSGSGETIISIEGYYSAISYSVPTAEALQLRPVNIQ